MRLVNLFYTYVSLRNSKLSKCAVVFISLIRNALTSYVRNFKHMKMQVSLLLSVLTVASTLIGLRYELKG